MKNISNKVVPLMCLLVLSFLGGCGGYARTANSSSGVQVYGTVDAGVQRERSH